MNSESTIFPCDLFLLLQCTLDICTMCDTFDKLRNGENCPSIRLIYPVNTVMIIPGPSEPPTTISNYLYSLVTELLKLWNGVQLIIHGRGRHIVRSALLSIGCDLPAARKTCGFLSYVANLGCSRCYVNFSGGFGRRNY